MPLIFAATNLTLGASQVFYAFPQGWDGTAGFVAAEPDAIPLNGNSYDEAVRASGAIPIAFPPVAIPGLPAAQAGSFFVDGGVANNTPVGQAVDAGATHVTVIFMDPPEDGPDHYPSGNLVQIASACYAVMAQTILNLDFALALRTNKAASAGGAPDKREICLRAIRPLKPLPLTILDFDKQPQIDQAFALGLADGQNPPPFTT
jgi:predicted acylesterase/phospholipase RssA